MIMLCTKVINVYPQTLLFKTESALGNSHGILRMLTVFANQIRFLTKRLSVNDPFLGEEEYT
jgi:hypothetical protein